MSVTLAGALNSALRDAMSDDSKVLVFGEDVGRLGGVFRISDGLQLPDPSRSRSEPSGWGVPGF